MDISKAYDYNHYLPHDLLIAKLEAYGFNYDSLQFVCSYLESRHHRVKIGSYKSSPKKKLRLVSHEFLSWVHCFSTSL